VVDEDHPELIAWQAVAPDGSPLRRQASLPRVIFVR
jgi:hypothetical protein